MRPSFFFIPVSDGNRVQPDTRRPVFVAIDQFGKPGHRGAPKEIRSRRGIWGTQAISEASARGCRVEFLSNCVAAGVLTCQQVLAMLHQNFIHPLYDRMLHLLQVVFHAVQSVNALFKMIG